MTGWRRHLASLLAAPLPPSRAFAIKRALWRFAGAELHANVRLGSGVRIMTSGPLSIGADSWIGHEVMIAGGDAPIRIGARCDIAPRVIIVSGSHNRGSRAQAAGEGRSDPITIGEGCWIGAGAIILGGVEIGAGSVIAAGAVVRESCPPCSLLAGVPATIVREETAKAYG